jgi:hypothetical protein
MYSAVLTRSQGRSALLKQSSGVRHFSSSALKNANNQFLKVSAVFGSTWALDQVESASFSWHVVALEIMGTGVKDSRESPSPLQFHSSDGPPFAGEW